MLRSASLVVELEMGFLCIWSVLSEGGRQEKELDKDGFLEV